MQAVSFRAWIKDIVALLAVSAFSGVLLMWADLIALLV